MSIRADYEQWAGQFWGHGRIALDNTVEELAQRFYGGNRNHAEWLVLEGYGRNNPTARDEIVHDWQSITPPKNGNGHNGNDNTNRG